MSNILISIIIPVYNTENYINQCLDSIFKYYKENNIEIVAINDGSTDNSLNVLQEYANHDSRLRIFNVKNGGVSKARNIGIKKSKGKYVMFVDSDDFLADNWYDLIPSIKDSDIYYFNNSLELSYSKEEILKCINGCNEKNIMIGGPVSKLFKRNFLLDYDLFFDEKVIVAEDKLFNTLCVLKTDNYEIINFQFYYYRSMIISSTKRFNSKIYDSSKELINAYYKAFELSDISDGVKRIICDRIKFNSITTIVHNISYIKSYSAAKMYFLILNDSYYRSILSPKMKNKVIYYLVKFKLYFMLFIIIKGKNYLRFKMKNREESYIKI